MIMRWACTLTDHEPCLTLDQVASKNFSESVELFLNSVEITNTAIVSCGSGGSSGVLQVRSVQQFNFSNVTLQEWSTLRHILYPPR